MPRVHPDSLLASFRSPTYLRWQAGVQTLWLVGLMQGPLVTHGFSWHWMGPTLASVLVYLACTLGVFAGPQSRLRFHAGAIVVLGFALWPVNPISLGYVVIGLSLLAFAHRPVDWLVATAAATLLTAVWAWCFGIPYMHVWVVLGASLVSGCSNYLYARGARSDVALRLSQAEVQRLATLAERERIGRDLHDLLGHTLSLITLKSELARRLALVDPPRAQQEMEEVERVARHALSEVRSAVSGLRAGDLASELVSARLMLEVSGIALQVTLPDRLELAPATEAELALVLREAVTNIHRHSRATEACVVITRNGGAFSMRITDNGCGGLAAHGNGVSGMRERISRVGGRLAIASPARQGTTLTIDMVAACGLLEHTA
ncbi:sensor histidine kinase [Xanthomonas sp. NCPPB 2632]|uniref:sensor histidine kinase n=1 Tax=Xanthomonas sp. NCPPB 2632 TaxID=3240912 RepID=UPI003511DB6D